MFRMPHVMRIVLCVCVAFCASCSVKFTFTGAQALTACEPIAHTHTHTHAHELTSFSIRRPDAADTPTLPWAAEALNGSGVESFAQNPNGDAISNVCLTAGCVKSAAAVLAAMDAAVEPCDDFYQFACGGYIRDTVIPDDRTALNLFSEIGDKLNEQIRVLIDRPVVEADAPPFRMAKHLYSACMNRTHIEERGLRPLIEQVESMGGWPVVKGDAWAEKDWSWQRSVSDFRHRGFSMDYFFDFSIGIDLRNSSERIIDVSARLAGGSYYYMR